MRIRTRLIAIVADSMYRQVLHHSEEEAFLRTSLSLHSIQSRRMNYISSHTVSPARRILQREHSIKLPRVKTKCIQLPSSQSWNTSTIFCFPHRASHHCVWIRSAHPAKMGVECTGIGTICSVGTSGYPTVSRRTGNLRGRSSESLIQGRTTTLRYR